MRCPNCNEEVIECVAHEHCGIKFCNVNCVREWKAKNKEAKEVKEAQK